MSAQITGFGWVTAPSYGRGRTGGVPLWQAGKPQPPGPILQTLSGGSRFGRLDLFSQIGVAAVALALKDANRLHKAAYPKTTDGHDLGLICATTSSCNQTDHNFFKTVQANPHLASPGLFVYTLATSFLGEAALRFAIKGTSLALIEPQPGGAEALRIGLEQLSDGDEEVMVVGVCNLFEQANTTAPFFSGALFLVLEKDQSRQIPFYATISCTARKRGFLCDDQPCSDIFSLTEIMTS